MFNGLHAVCAGLKLERQLSQETGTILALSHRKLSQEPSLIFGVSRDGRINDSSSFGCEPNEETTPIIRIRQAFY